VDFCCAAVGIDSALVTTRIPTAAKRFIAFPSKKLEFAV
jgi:hypothetical protein